MNNNLLHCSTFIDLPDFNLIRKFLKITPCIGLKRTITCPCSERISHTSLDQGQLKMRCCMSSTSMLHLGHLNSLISPMHTELLCRNTRLDFQHQARTHCEQGRRYTYFHSFPSSNLADVRFL